MGVAKKIDSERIGTVSVFPFTRQLITNTSFPYATISVIPSHTRVDGKPFHGDDKVRSGKPVTKINFKASFRLFTKFNTPKNYPLYGTCVTSYNCSQDVMQWLIIAC